MDPSHLMWQGMDVVACIRWLGPLVFHAAAKDAKIEPGVATRGVLDTMFAKVPAGAEGKTPTGIGYWCTRWPDDPAWRFVAVGVTFDGIAAVCVFGWEEDADAIHRRMLDRVTAELADPAREPR